MLVGQNITHLVSKGFWEILGGGAFYLAQKPPQNLICSTDAAIFVEELNLDPVYWAHFLVYPLSPRGYFVKDKWKQRARPFYFDLVSLSEGTLVDEYFFFLLQSSGRGVTGGGWKGCGTNLSTFWFTV